MSRSNVIATLIGLLTFAFIITTIWYQPFQSWVFDRHQNQWSWYIRPLFLILFCYFSYQRNWLGISITLFMLFTSMCWFNTPISVNNRVEEFLTVERAWLNSEWSWQHWALILTVPMSMTALALACWKRNLRIGIVVVCMMAFGKIAWSLYEAGSVGSSILLPAILGLIICVTLLLIWIQRTTKK